jgi:hypothetical protein
MHHQKNIKKNLKKNQGGYVRNMELKTGLSNRSFGAERFAASLLAFTSFGSYKGMDDDIVVYHSKLEQKTTLTSMNKLYERFSLKSY